MIDTSAQQSPLFKARMIYGALISSVFFMWLVALAAIEFGGDAFRIGDPTVETILVGLAAVGLIGAVGAALFFQSKVNAIASDVQAEHPERAPDERFNDVLTPSIIAWAVIEGAGMMAAVVFLLTGMGMLAGLTALACAAGFGIMYPRPQWYTG